MTNLEEARAFFAGDRFATENGAVIDEIGADYAVCSMKITPHHLNAAGRVMGGAVFMLADFAFAVASNFGHPADVTTTSQITFLRPSQGKMENPPADHPSGERKNENIKNRPGASCKICGRLQGNRYVLSFRENSSFSSR